MISARASLLLGIFLVCSCAPAPRVTTDLTPAQVEAVPGETFDLWSPCTRTEAERWSRQADRSPAAALQAASCYATLARKGEDGRGEADARQGLKLAEEAARRYPASGAAHYLNAYLAGLLAERTPLQGLSLVPVIEEEARRAAELDPTLDAGGPDRMLGELYLRAPAFPVSVGDAEAAVEHFRRAVTIAPTTENRLGLGEALLETGKIVEGCALLRDVVRERGAPAERARERIEQECRIP